MDRKMTSGHSTWNGPDNVDCWMTNCHWLTPWYDCVLLETRECLVHHASSLSNWSNDTVSYTFQSCMSYASTGIDWRLFILLRQMQPALFDKPHIHMTTICSVDALCMFVPNLEQSAAPSPKKYVEERFYILRLSLMKRHWPFPRCEISSLSPLSHLLSERKSTWLTHTLVINNWHAK